MKKDNLKTEVVRENRYGYGYGSADRNIFSTPVPVWDHTIYLDDLCWLEDHQERLQLIRMAGPDDSLRLIINSPGGEVRIAMAYAQAIRESQAHIVTHAEGQVCSAGTVLWLSNSERTVAPLTIFMFHNYQGGTYGDGANMHSQVIFERQYFDRVLPHYYEGVLTSKEIEKIMGGGQVWLDEKEIISRVPTAVLLDEENILRIKRGMPPLGAAKPQKGKVTLSIKTLNNEEFVLDMENLDESVIKGMTNEEIRSVIESISSNTELPIVFTDDYRPNKFEELFEILKDLCREVVEAKREGEEKA